MMLHMELVKIVLGVHGPVLLGALAAYYRYGDRTEVFNRSLSGVDSALRRMRQLLSGELGKRLQSVFQGQETVPSLILGPDGNTYTEQCANPWGGELYREALRDFVEGNSNLMTDYHSACQARERWCLWAKRLSWALFSLLVWQACIVGATALLDVICQVQIPDWVFLWAGVPTAILFAGCLIAMCSCLRHHDRIQGFRMRYDTP